MSTEPSTESLHLAPVPIRLRGCGKHFGGQRVLDPLDLDIGAGETLVLLGPSGCGKTTTLRIVAGLEAPDAGGTVRFGDEEVTAHPIERRRVGMVFQNYALFPNLGVRGNVEYGLRIQRRRNRLSDAQIRARADALLDMMHLTPYAERAIGQLSGGQRQRVALARALAPEPRVLLLDEPLTALDAKLRESVRAEMDRLLRGLGITTVYVTHDQEEAMALADRIVVMDAGRIAQIGTPREIYFQPANRHVADFIGIMNRLDGERQGGAFVCAGGRVAVPAGEGAGAGAASALFFRPEDAVLADPGRAALKGVVESAVFLGFRTRVRVAGVSNAPLFIDVPGRQQFAPGHAVGIEIAADRLLTLQA
ncbi:ABC transporter ATP-binding protein [Ralstonia pseudosolanacearum]|uniref:ABC transporter ATP-binding protein n=1 Tax=Ralstonia solanacearum TaxID=305 RepID=A0AA92IEH8_RALSL|nr:ABC transporter ATP-binding protein [Ralstonia pseudosolanacearum]QCX49549.1 ABC transporter ATP-binding protein [Ralstonia pseudosolanacearum]